MIDRVLRTERLCCREFATFSLIGVSEEREKGKSLICRLFCKEVGVVAEFLSRKRWGKVASDFGNSRSV